MRPVLLAVVMAACTEPLPSSGLVLTADTVLLDGDEVTPAEVLARDEYLNIPSLEAELRERKVDLCHPVRVGPKATVWQVYRVAFSCEAAGFTKATFTTGGVFETPVLLRWAFGGRAAGLMIVVTSDAVTVRGGDGPAVALPASTDDLRRVVKRVVKPGETRIAVGLTEQKTSAPMVMGVINGLTKLGLEPTIAFVEPSRAR